MSEFPKTRRNQVARKPDRSRYDRSSIYAIVDEALYCSAGFAVDGQPYVIPINHARRGDTIYLHGAKASRLLKHLQDGNPVCLSFTLLDGIVFARSVFDHSVNYRSAVIFGCGREVESDEEKLLALEAITEHIAPGRWVDARRPTQKELNATLVVAVDVEDASAKMRAGMPVDGEEDMALPVWAGVLPLSLQPGEPQRDPALGETIETPDYVRNYRRKAAR